MKLLIIVGMLSLFTVSACGEKTKSNSDTTTKVKGDEKDRPSDGGEGFPAYLIDPDSIVLTPLEDNELKIQLEPGTLESSDGEVIDLIVHFWSIEGAELDKIINADEVDLTVTGERLVSAKPSEAGFLEAVLTIGDDVAIVLQVTAGVAESDIEFTISGIGTENVNAVYIHKNEQGVAEVGVFSPEE